MVRAFNDNLPFDDFITWQLAGDLLETSSMEQQVATGFVRMNPTTAEGGVIPAEFQAKNNFDRVETLGTVFLGMSMVCARCHTHKYDPIPQQEYYELMAFFNSTSENPLDGNAYVYGPVLQVPENQRLEGMARAAGAERRTAQCRWNDRFRGLGARAGNGSLGSRSVETEQASGSPCRASIAGNHG